MIKKIISVFLAYFMMMTSFVTTMAADTQKITFKDVDADTLEGIAIYKLAENGIISGNGDGTFTPENSVTRAQLCKMINNIWKYTEPSTENFKDVTSDKWYYSHVLIGKKAGYINGFEDGTFRGDAYVTREQVCAILCRVANLSNIEFTINVSDVVSGWARDCVNKVIGNGLMQLESGGNFRATENMKRVEVAMVLSYFVTETASPDKTDDKTTVSNGTSSGSSGSSSESSSGGASSGSSSGSSGGGSSKPSVDYTEKNAEVVKNLTSAKSELKKNRELFTEPEKEIIDIVIEVLDDIIDDKDEYIISDKTVYTEYTDEIMKALDKYLNLSESGKNSFVSKISQLDSKTFNFLKKFFDVDASDIDKLG